MADESVTASAVKASDAAVRGVGVAGVAIAAGKTLYHDANGTMKLADANADAGATPGINTVIGISLHGAEVGQPIEYAISDPDFIPGFATAAGVPYFSSGTAGGVTADVPISGIFSTLIGIGKVADIAGTGTMVLQIVTAGVAHGA